jgi:tetratricopeptide (TPR) repeat protein
LARETGHEPLRAEVEQARAMVLEVRGDLDGAERAYTAAHHLATAALHDIVAAQTAIGLTTLVGVARRDVEGGLSWSRFATAALRRIEGMQAHALCEAYLENALGQLDDARGDGAGYLRHVERALAVAEGAMGPHDPSVGLVLSNHGIALQRVGRHAEAESVLARALAVHERALGPEHRNVAVVLHNLGAARLELGRHADAVAPLRRALAIRERVLPDGDPATAYTRINLAIALQHGGDLATAEALARRAHAVLVERLGSTHPRTVLAADTLAAISLARRGG